MYRRQIASALALLVSCFLFGQPAGTYSENTRSDSISRIGFSAYFNPGKIIALDRHVENLVSDNKTYGVGIEMSYQTMPKDSCGYASDFRYPSFNFGIRYTFNNDVRMHRGENMGMEDWQIADYGSRLGNSISAYFHFCRPFVRARHWEVDYTIGVGLAYSDLAYEKSNNVDNELIGSHMSVYFNFGVHTTWHIVPQWGIRAGVDFVHHSNGALDRPNKGSNALGPMIGLTYTPYYEELVNSYFRYDPPFKHYWYMNVSVGVGAMTASQDWNITQYDVDVSDPDYRTEEFKLYATYSAQVDVMYRYQRRWASGIGVDLFYGTYYKHQETIDENGGYSYSHSPWSLGIAGKHEIFYRNWSVPMEFGFYVYRQMGRYARKTETPYYERIGVRYNMPKADNLYIGISLQAHAAKANFTEINVGVPFRF